MAQKKYGDQDVSFQAAGGEEGLQKLVEDFYQFMDTLPEAQKIRQMHPKNLSKSIDKLARFLCGWLGGPRRFQEKYGPIHIPKVHLPFPIEETERDAWLLCMERALEKQDYALDFKQYLMRELFVPAERIRTIQKEKH